MTQKTFPPVPKILLEALEASFPNTLPVTPNLDIEELRVLQGEQNVIRLLRFQYEKQSKNILEK